MQRTRLVPLPNSHNGAGALAIRTAASKRALVQTGDMASVFSTSARAGQLSFELLNAGKCNALADS